MSRSEGGGGGATVDITAHYALRALSVAPAARWLDRRRLGGESAHNSVEPTALRFARC